MRVLFFSHQAEFIYGGEVCTLSFMQELKKTEEIFFASPSGPYAERASFLASSFVVPSVQFSRKISHLPKIVRAIYSTQKKLQQIIREKKIQILHATSLKAMAYAFFVNEVKVIWHHHDILPAGFFNSLWVKVLGARADLILVPSEATKHSLLVAGVPAKKVEVLFNGFSPDLWKKRGPRSSQDFHVALVGEISFRKGLDRLREVLAVLRKRGTLEGVQVSIVGAELSEPDFAKKIREDLRQEPVSFLGRRENVKEILQTVDLLLVPSRQDPLPTVIVEAALSGVPALGSTAGGIPEMIVPGETGFLAETAEEFAEGLEKARNLATWQKLSDGARVLAEEKFSIEKAAKKLLGFYEKLFKESY